MNSKRESRDFIRHLTGASLVPEALTDGHEAVARAVELTQGNRAPREGITPHNMRPTDDVRGFLDELVYGGGR
jgi:hypothetical protein